MFAFPAAKRPLGLAASLLSVVIVLSAAGAAVAAEQGYLGVLLQDLTPSLAKALQLGDRSGVIVNEVVDGSPAEKAGLRDGDVILQFNGDPVSDYTAFTRAVRALKPGDDAKVTVLRDGREKSLDVEIGRREADDTAGQVRIYRGGGAGDGEAGDLEDLGELKDLEGLKELKGLEGLKELKDLEGLKGLEGLDHLKLLEDGNARVFVLPRGGDGDAGTWFEGGDDSDAPGEGRRHVIVRKLDADRGWLGVHMNALNGQLGEYFGVEDGAGVLVTEVVADSPAAAAGLKAGDVIVKAGDRTVASPDDLHEAMSGTKPGDDLKLKVLRKGAAQTLTATLGKMPDDAGGARKRVKIITDGEPGELKLMAPYLKQRLDAADRDQGDQERKVIIRQRQQADEDLATVREEMEALRQELKELRKELERDK